jgi:hypothetical protein
MTLTQTFDGMRTVTSSLFRVADGSGDASGRQ